MKILHRCIFLVLLAMGATSFAAEPVELVRPFVGTTNFGTTNPGAVCPNGLMSVVPFNVMGSDLNVYDKDSRWWSTPYEFYNKFFTGFSHVNLSGVGCPDLGSLLLMATTGDLEVDYTKYGSTYTNEAASPGYYTNVLDRYDIKTEVSATKRSSIARFTMPEGRANILLNLGEGLTNESGAYMRRVGDREIEGCKLLGTFCYTSQAVFPIYFVMRVDRAPEQSGYWKMQRPMTGVEAEWDKDHGQYKLYTKYSRDIAGDDIGAYMSYDVSEGEQLIVRMGVSMVSIENARMNLDAEQHEATFDQIHADARQMWNDDLSRIKVEGGTQEQQEVFYTALYHTLIHPNLINDVNGDYPAMESGEVRSAKGNHYTVFSLWDTYRNLHQLMTLVYPERQIEMVRSMVDMYKQSGWLPKWELYGRETFTMEGDPSIPVISDTWRKGLRDFDIESAYRAMIKSATSPSETNLMRPDNDYYMHDGHVPLLEQYDNSVSHALEYYLADAALSKLAESLGKTEDAKLFKERSLNYKHYYCKEFGTMRPILPNGEFYEPFNPMQGENFEPSPGFHEGNAWNYTFYVPHDVLGLSKLMGGKRKFIDKLQMVFDEGLYDPANEPDIAYPYLFSYFGGEEWRTQREVNRLLAKYFTTKPDGIPGNDDAGTMSAWAIFSMMGFYPDNAADVGYTFTSPVFDRVEIELDPTYYGESKLVVETSKTDASDIYINKIKVGGRPTSKYRISHDQLVNCGTLSFELQQQPK